MAKFRHIIILSVFITVSCNSTKNLTLMSSASSPEAAALLQSTINAHGGTKYETAHYAFVFRNKNYTFHNNHGEYTYTLSQEKDGVGYHDVLTNDSFTRSKNGVQQSLTQKQTTAYTEGVNSVVYFATLPHKLNDPAVNVSHEGITTISNKKYQVMKVTFDQEGGGRDFEDNYYYWVNDSTYKLQSASRHGVIFITSDVGEKRAQGIIEDRYGKRAELIKLSLAFDAPIIRLTVNR